MAAAERPVLTAKQSMTLAEWRRVPTRVPSGQVGATMPASRHCEKAVSARVCGLTWKSPAMTKGRARERASAPTVARMATLSAHRRPLVTR